jgi:hypothetical protein
MMIWLDTDPDILAWNSEGVIIHYIDPVERKARKYYVDFQILIMKKDGTKGVTLIEIKPYKQTIRPRPNGNKSEKTMVAEAQTYATNTAKWIAAKAYCKDKGWDFKIITEKDLFNGIDQGYKPPRKK